jgi:hypothetical protein
MYFYRARSVGNFVKMDLREVDWGEGVMDWTHLSQDRDKRWALVNWVMSFRVP